MRQNLRCTLAIFVLLVTVIIDVRSEEINYCQKINALIEKSDKAKTEQERSEADRKFREYIDSLNSQQILIAGRQYAQWSEKKVSGKLWDSEDIVGIFYSLLDFYSQKMGTEGLTPIIKILRNKKENARWREILIWYTGLDGLDERLSNAQQWKLVEVFDTVLRDEKDGTRVRGMACMRLYEILDTKYHCILSDDAAVGKFRKQNPGVNIYEHLGKEIKLIPETVQKLKPIQKAASEHIEFLLTIAKEPQLDPLFKDSAIYALGWYQCIPLSRGKEEEIILRLNELTKTDKK